MIDDGLNKWQRYRLKDLDSYRARKAAYARTPSEREKRRILQQKWRDKNRAHYNEWARKNHQKNRARIIPRLRQHYHQSRYGLSTEEALALKLKSPCGICGQRKSKMFIDHDHKVKTPSYRGVLCFTCNTHLGWFESVGLTRIQKYLNPRTHE